MPGPLTITARPHGKVDHLGHRRARTFVRDDDARPSWFAYGFELAREVRRRRRKRRR